MITCIYEKDNMAKGKKFIAPGAWFSMTYPAEWSEFDGGEDSFLFYNADRWTGNFRISAFRGEDANYGMNTVRDELRHNRKARQIKIGRLTCAYSIEPFEEDGEQYENHQWVAGIGDVSFEISFATKHGGSTKQAEDIIASLQLRLPEVKYPPETIPVRLSEQYAIDAAFDNMKQLTKKHVGKELRGDETDLKLLQNLAASGSLNRHKREAWIDLGITLCVIATNVADGFRWQTLIDGNREDPVLLRETDGKVIDPLRLVWSRVRDGQEPDVVAAYESIFE